MDKKISVNFKTTLIILLLGILLGTLYSYSKILFNVGEAFHDEIFNPLGLLVFIESILAYKIKNIRSLVFLNFIFYIFLFFSASLIKDLNTSILVIYDITLLEVILADILFGIVMSIVITIPCILFIILKLNKYLLFIPILLMVIDMVYIITITTNNYYMYTLIIIELILLFVYTYKIREKITH